MVVWKSLRLKKSYMGKLERQIEKRELWNISGKPVQCMIFFFLFKRYNTKSEEGIFASESWLLLIKKKIKKKRAKSEYFRPEYIFTWNGLVFKARQNRGVLVPN